MNVLWSKTGEETEFVLAFPGSRQELALTATIERGGRPFFRNFAFLASGDQPVLFTHNGLESVRLQAHWMGESGALAQTDALHVSFTASMEPTYAQLFSAHVTKNGIAFEIGPRTNWPSAVPVYDLQGGDAAKAADALRQTDTFKSFLRQLEARRDGTDPIIFISATPLRIEPPDAVLPAAPLHMSIAPALDLWPLLSLVAKIRVIRVSDRQHDLPPVRTAIDEEYARKTQPFKDAIEIAVEGDRTVATSLRFRHARRQAVASSVSVARIEPELNKIVPRYFEPILDHPLEWENKKVDGWHVANIDDLPIARGDWFLLVSPDAQLYVKSIEAPDGTRQEDVPSVAAAEGIDQRASLVAWRHDGVTLKTFSDRPELKALSSSPIYRGLIDEALRPWTGPGQDVSLSRLWRTLLQALKIPQDPGLPTFPQDFVTQIIGDEGTAQYRLVARHSPFVALAALSRWLALQRTAENANWTNGLGRDDRSMERLLSPIAEWLARSPVSPAPASPIEVTDANTDVVDHFLRWVQHNYNLKLNHQRGAAPENVAGIALLLLRGVRRKGADLATQAEKLRVNVAPAEAIDPRAHELIQTFYRVFFRNPIERPDADLGFYRAMLAGGEGKLQSRYDGKMLPDDYCTMQDLNGGPLYGADMLAEFTSTFGTLTRALGELKTRQSQAELEAKTATEDLAALRARIESAKTSYDVRDLNDLADRIVRNFKASDPQWDGARFLELVGELALPGTGSPRDHARHALLHDRLRAAEAELTRAFEATQAVNDFNAHLTGKGLRNQDESIKARSQALLKTFSDYAEFGDEDPVDFARAKLERLRDLIRINSRSRHVDTRRADDLSSALKELHEALAEAEAAVDALRPV